MDMSAYLANKLAAYVLTGQPYTPPTNMYVALYTTAPTANDVGTEVSSVDYARQEVTFNTSNKNDNEIIFPETTTSWGNITHVGIRDDLTGGNLLFHKELGAGARVIISGDQLLIKKNNLIVTFS